MLDSTAPRGPSKMTMKFWRNRSISILRRPPRDLWRAQTSSSTRCKSSLRIKRKIPLSCVKPTRTPLLKTSNSSLGQKGSWAHWVRSLSLKSRGNQRYRKRRSSKARIAQARTLSAQAQAILLKMCHPLCKQWETGHERLPRFRN